jgi:hypothetical protein
MRFSISAMLSLAAFTLLISSCTKDQLDPVNTNENGELTGEIWTGATLTFSKAPESDPTVANKTRIALPIMSGSRAVTTADRSIMLLLKMLPANQIAQKVPLWAVGSINQVESLSFTPFREAVGKPKEAVGKNLVMYLIEDDVYIGVKLTEWGEQRNGAFTYERSTKE